MDRSAAVEAIFERVQPPTTFEETVERLGTAIKVGLLAPGSKLPPERELAEQLDISRSTLRQALTTLVQSGHLVAARGRGGGTFVADDTAAHRRPGAGPRASSATCSTTAWRSRPAPRCSPPSAASRRISSACASTWRR